MQITDKIMMNPGSSWLELFEKADFFGMYKTYVHVVASASTAEGIKDWCAPGRSLLATPTLPPEKSTPHPSCGAGAQ